MRRRVIFIVLMLVLSTVLTSYTWASTNTAPEVKEEPAKEIYISKSIQETIKASAEATPEELGLSAEEIDLIALVTMAEAENQSELGKRLVIDVILNRVESERFSNTVDGVIYAKNQFECMWNGRVDRCKVKDDIRRLVIEELNNRTNDKVLYFRANYYHNFGTPVLSEGDHYFSTV